MVLDRDGRILYVNYAEEGYELDDVVGSDVSEFIHPDYRQAHWECLHRILSNVSYSRVAATPGSST